MGVLRAVIEIPMLAVLRQVAEPVALFFRELCHNGVVVRSRNVQLVAQGRELLYLFARDESIRERDADRILVPFQDVRRVFLALPGPDGMNEESFAQILWRLDIGPFPVFNDIFRQRLLCKGLLRAAQATCQEERGGGDNQDGEEVLHPRDQAQCRSACKTIEYVAHMYPISPLSIPLPPGSEKAFKLGEDQNSDQATECQDYCGSERARHRPGKE
jgi:hypothetical protein